MSLTRAEVLAAGAAWVWMPPGGTENVTDDYHHMVFPDWFGYQQVVRFRPTRDPGAVATEVLDLARATGLPSVTWWVTDAEPDTEALVVSLGGEATETLDFLALDLLADRPTAPPAPPGIDVRRVGDVSGQRDFHTVSAAVFDEPVPPADEITHDPADGSRIFVAYDGDRPVGTAGVSVVDGETGVVARMWSGCVLERHRRRGIYLALLHARLDVAAAEGARMALVRGRVETSAPILRGSGFAVYGQQRGYRVPLSPSPDAVPAS